MIFRKFLLRSFFLYKEGISSHESKESEATESGNLRRGEISLWKIETELNRKNGVGILGNIFGLFEVDSLLII